MSPRTLSERLRTHAALADHVSISVPSGGAVQMADALDGWLDALAARDAAEARVRDLTDTVERFSALSEDILGQDLRLAGLGRLVREAQVEAMMLGALGLVAGGLFGAGVACLLMWGLG